MKHDISINTYYILKDVKYSKKLLNELKEQFPNLRWFSGIENDGEYLSNKPIYVIDKAGSGIPCLTHSSRKREELRPTNYKVINYPQTTLKERIKEFKI